MLKKSFILLLLLFSACGFNRQKISILKMPLSSKMMESLLILQKNSNKL